MCAAKPSAHSPARRVRTGLTPARKTGGSGQGQTASAPAASDSAARRWASPSVTPPGSITPGRKRPLTAPNPPPNPPPSCGEFLRWASGYSWAGGSGQPTRLRDQVDDQPVRHVDDPPWRASVQVRPHPLRSQREPDSLLLG